MMTERSLADGISFSYSVEFNEYELSLLNPGGFNNVGYWRDIDLGREISREDRIRSEQDLYRYVLESIGLNEDDRLLDVACGRGRGCALAFDLFNAAEVTGIDMTVGQIERARADNAETVLQSRGRLNYYAGSAADMSLPDGHFDKIICIEAMNHFPDIDGFLREVVRVARRQARICISTIFATDNSNIEGSPNSHAEWYNYPHVVVTDLLAEIGFQDIGITSLGDNCFRGYDLWLKRIGGKFNEKFGNLLDQYDRGLIDYLSVTAALDG